MATYSYLERNDELADLECAEAVVNEREVAAWVEPPETGLTFLEVFVDALLKVCEQRDQKGLHAKARAGEVSDLTGLDSPYEEPVSPDYVLTR